MNQNETKTTKKSNQKLSRVKQLLDASKGVTVAATLVGTGFFTLGFTYSQAREEAASQSGVSFQCSEEDLNKIDAEMQNYLTSVGIENAWIKKTRNSQLHTLNYSLKTAPQDANTINLRERPEYKIGTELVEMPTAAGQLVQVPTVSKKEIVLALFQHGRHTPFSKQHCSARSFKDHVGVRQNTVLWAQKLHWGWPDGGPAFWNSKFWHRGTPHKNVALTDAFMDAFHNQSLYGIGCYTATKIVMVHAILDYYNRVSPDSQKLNQVIQNLMVDGEPLVDIEPPWSGDIAYDYSANQKPGKILTHFLKIAPLNFVPGDWAYMVNTHMGTKDKTGYEGSNAIYLGGGRFDDYYNDHNHSYTYREKLNEVYQWENGVFSRTQHADKIKPVSEEDFRRFGQHPSQGGYVLDIRMFHTLL